MSIRAGQEEEFEAAFGQAKAILAAAQGCRRLSLSRCVERPSGYLLLVEWDSLADHMEGFRGSPQFGQWRELLGPFFESAPVVEHYRQVADA